MMNKKVIFTFIILFVAIASISSVSAWWIFGGGNDANVNGVTFHLPEGFDVDNPVKSDSDNTYERTVYKNTENKDTVDIRVEDKSMEDSVIGNSLIKKGYEKKNIDGKDGFYHTNVLSKTVDFVYIDNDKVVSIIVPLVYDQYGDNVKSYEELLSEII